MMYTFSLGVAKNLSMFRCCRQGPRGSGNRRANVSARKVALSARVCTKRLRHESRLMLPLRNVPAPSHSVLKHCAAAARVSQGF